MKQAYLSYKYILAFLFFSVTYNLAQAQLNGALLISGKVTDGSGTPLEAISIILKGTRKGTLSDSTGNFKLVSNKQPPFTLVLSGIGFAEKEVVVTSLKEDLQVQLFTQAYYTGEVVVTASRQAEQLSRSAVTIEKLDIKALKQTPAPSFYDALANVKGVQMTTSSLTFKVPNTRGFNIPNNFRFMQMVDGVDVQAATLGVPLGNAIGPTELDIESVEITPGASSALYGMNAINGMSQLMTRNPFKYQGLSFYQKIGANHLDGKDKPFSPLTETAIRYAKAFNDKFAFKINASYLKGTDWVANNKNDFNPQTTANPAFPELSGANNVAYDGVNSYGNESNIVITDKNGKRYNVRRTGYFEKDLTDYSVQNIKLDAALHYRITPTLEASYSYRYGKMDGVFQRGNRIQLKGANVQNHKIELVNSEFLLRGYVSIENSGHSYNMKPLADNLEASFKQNSQWAADYKKGLDEALTAGEDLASAHKAGRAKADDGRFTPGTAAFEEQKQKIININDWDIYPVSTNPQDTTGGAALWTRSRFYQAEGTWNLRKYIPFVNVLVGADYRLYDLIPDGNNFVDFSKPLKERNTPGGKNIHYWKYGAFVQASKLLLNDKLKLTGSLRFDKNGEFDVKFNPRLSAVYTLKKSHNIRASWQNGFRFPSLFEAYSFVNNGNVRRVGGLPIVEQGCYYYTNSALTNSVDAYTTQVNTLVSQQGLSVADAQQQAKSILKVANPKSIRPEEINSFEIGYKTSLLQNKLFIDAEAYYNIYRYFIGQLEVTVPNAGSVADFTDAVVLNSLYNRNAQTRYRVQVNSQSKVSNYGAALAISYTFYKTYTASGNINFNKLSQADKSDPLIPGFNTPNLASNLSIGNRAITKNVGFNIVWHWQNSFYWQNLFGNGTINAYNTIDAQTTFQLPALKSNLKIGATNILNHRYTQYIGGPTIGALAYAAWTLELK